MSKQNFFVRISFSYLGEIASYVFLTAGVFAMARFMSVEDFGTFNVLMGAAFFTAIIIDCGIPSFLLRFVGEHIETKEYRTAAGLLKIATVFTFILGLAVFLVLLFLPLIPVTIFQDIGKQEAFLIAICSVIKLLTQIMEMYLSALYREGHKNAIMALGSGLKFLAVIYGLGIHLSVIKIFMLYWLLDALTVVAYAIVLHHFLIRPAGFTTIADGIKGLQGKKVFMLREYLYKLLGFFWDTKFDIFVVLFFFGMQFTGTYSFAVGIVAVIAAWSPDTVLQPMLRSFMVRKFTSKNDLRGLGDFFRLSTTFKAFFVIPALALITVFFDPAVSVFFKNKYSGATMLFYIFISFVIFKIMISPVREVLLLLNRNDISLKTHIALLYKIILIVLLVPFYGINGLVIACGSFFMIVFFLQLYLAREIFRFEFEWPRIAVISINTAFAVLAGILLREWSRRGTIELTSSAIICILVFLAASRINKTFSQEERDTVNRIIEKNIWVF